MFQTATIQAPMAAPGTKFIVLGEGTAPVRGVVRSTREAVYFTSGMEVRLVRELTHTIHVVSLEHDALAGVVIILDKRLAVPAKPGT